MPKFTILLTKKAEKQIDKLKDNIAIPILEAITQLENNPRPTGCKKLKGRDAYRIKIGNYRVIYEIFDNELLIEVIALGHRKDIYK
ncbi:MAG: hypothetical protein RLZZ414_197 [Bacteroidota bacterium]|jgi:mRNA interferase RelE/StbE